MGRYVEITATNMADVISGIQNFFTAGGWTLGTVDISSTYNRTMFTAAKNGMGHKICAVYSGRFPFAAIGYNWKADASQGSDGVYEAAIGMHNTAYTGGDYFFIAPHLNFPCRCFFFETSDQSVLLAFEAEAGRWQNLFSGAVNKSLTGNWSGGMVMTGCTSPSRGWQGIEDNGFMMPNGLYAIANGSNYPITTLCSYKGNLISPYETSPSSPTLWPGGNLTVWYSTSVKDEYYFPVKRREGIVRQASQEGLLLNSIGMNSLLGLPTLFPMTMRFGTVFGAYLTDVWCCSQAATIPGGTLWMGTQKYITLPVYKYDTTSLGMAIRVN